MEQQKTQINARLPFLNFAFFAASREKISREVAKNAKKIQEKLVGAKKFLVAANLVVLSL